MSNMHSEAFTKYINLSDKLFSRIHMLQKGLQNITQITHLLPSSKFEQKLLLIHNRAICAYVLGHYIIIIIIL